MWIPGTWRFRSCDGHDNPEVGDGGLVNYCKIVTTELENGEMEILVCCRRPCGVSSVGPNIVFMLNNSEDDTMAGQDDNNLAVIGEPTDSGMVIKLEGTEITCIFDGLQITVIEEIDMPWGNTTWLAGNLED